MSLESARAFCVRMMSDPEFLKEIAAKNSLPEIDSLLKVSGYDFKKSELMKAIGDFAGKQLNEDDLLKLVGEFFTEQMSEGSGEAAAAGCESVMQWLKALQ